MADEFILNRANEGDQYPRLAESIEKILSDDGQAKVTVVKKSNGTMPLDRHWRALMPQVALIMQSYGVTMKMSSPSGKAQFERVFDKDDAHDLFTSHFMPIGENGKRKSWSKNGREGMEVATTGDRCHAIERLYAYWLEKGHNLQRFNDSEYESLMKSQEI